MLIGAQARSNEPDSVVVVGTRLPQPESVVQRHVDLISRDDIETTQPASVPQLLRSLPGLWIDQPGGAGGVSSLYIRGGEPNFALVLIDGVRVNDSTNSRGGSFDLSSAALESLDRIETIRGPRSSIYGSDALSGVVNLVTPGGESTAANAVASFGSHGYQRGSLLLNGQLGPIKAGFTAGVTDHGKQRSGNELEAESATFRVSAPIGTHTEISAFGRAADTRARSFPDDSGGIRFAALRELDDREAAERSGGMAFHTALSADLYLDARLDGAHRSERLRSPGVAPGVRDPFGIPGSRTVSDYDTLSTSVALRFEPAGRWRAVLGGEGREERGDSTGVLLLDGFELPAQFHLRRQAAAVFSEVEWRPSAGVSVQGAIRLDDPEGHGRIASPRVALNIALPLDSVWYVQAGRGFKLPSFFALGNPIVGNPQLRPEESESFESGLEFSACANRCGLQVAAFRTRYQDLIDFDAGPPPRLVNRSSAVAWGVEGRVRFEASARFVINAQATYTDIELRGTTEQLRHRPQWRAGTELRFLPSEALSISAHAWYVGSMLDSSIATGDVTLPDYVQIDAASTWQVTERVGLQLALDNVFDRDYENAVGVPAPSRTARVALRYQW